MSVKLVSIQPWRDGLLALDDMGRLWWGSISSHEWPMLKFLTWTLLPMPAEE